MAPSVPGEPSAPSSVLVKFRPRKDEKITARIYVSSETLLKLTGELENGKPCVVENTVGEQSLRREATLWMDRQLTSVNGPNPVPVKASPAFQEACGLNLSDVYRISLLNATIPTAEEVELIDVTGKEQELPSRSEEEIIGWKYALRSKLEDLPDTVFPGVIFGGVFLSQKGQKRRFQVKSVNGSNIRNARFDYNTTKITLSTQSQKTRSDLKITGITGLNEPIDKLNSILGKFNRVRNDPKSAECAVVIHGGHGTGKTMLVERLIETGWGTVHRIEPWDKLTTITETFKRAHEQEPSIIVMEAFDRTIDKERGNRDAVIRTIGQELDKLATYEIQRAQSPMKVLVLVTCQDCQRDIPEELRREHRLLTQVFLPLPDVDGRRIILESLNLRLPAHGKEQTIKKWSERTHAYNGHDLRALIAMTRDINDRSHAATARLKLGNDNQNCFLTDAAFELALGEVRPSAMHDVNLKPPPTRWDDIRGQQAVKDSLRTAIQLLTARPELIADHPVTIPKGVLLFGPPGCSKTMVARALATESGLNLFAVKGAELLNMYLGESERALRALFSRARTAAPAMIFFDEIDSLAGGRSGFGSGGGGTTSTSSSAVSIVTTLLTEMDGFEATKNVLVVAATNRPQALDTALLRQGRFGRLIYVPPPDLAAREAMFAAFLWKYVGQTASAVAEIAPVLASLTEGYSGADINGICEQTAEAVWLRWVKMQHRGDVSSASVVGLADFMTAMKTAPKTITEEMLDGYKEWQSKFKHLY